MIAILGISAFYHDSAATILIDGKITKTGCSELALELDKIGYEEIEAST